MATFLLVPPPSEGGGEGQVVVFIEEGGMADQGRELSNSISGP